MQEDVQSLHWIWAYVILKLIYFSNKLNALNYYWIACLDVYSDCATYASNCNSGYIQNVKYSLVCQKLCGKCSAGKENHIKKNPFLKENW